jgi:hypothetical protein
MHMLPSHHKCKLLSDPKIHLKMHIFSNTPNTHSFIVSQKNGLEVHIGGPIRTSTRIVLGSLVCNNHNFK